MNIRGKKITELTEGLLEDVQVTNPHVPVDKIAKHLNLKVEYGPFNDELSGCIIRQGSSALICINENHTEQRKRFTLAHELGHFMMHNGKEGFIDKHLLININIPNLDTSKINSRRLQSSKSVDPEEIEANAFAAELLMPKKFVDQDMQKEEFRNDENFIRTMADRYQVSSEAMTMRLMKLGYLQA